MLYIKRFNSFLEKKGVFDIWNWEIVIVTGVLFINKLGFEGNSNFKYLGLCNY